jgi:hypothetical protein
LASSRAARTAPLLTSRPVLPAFALLAALALLPGLARAQAGPPFLTNDPGTPGNANWEINLGEMPTLARGSRNYQTPQIDLNFGVGDRIQVTYEVPYVLQDTAGQPQVGGWGNGYTGVKWRFLDEGEGGLQVSTFPQVELGGGTDPRNAAIAVPGPRYLLPVEATRRIGPLDVDVEVGYYLAGKGPRERIIGLAVGRPVDERLELDAEIYDDNAFGTAQHTTTLDVGGRYKLNRSFIALFMVGRSISGFGDGRPELLGYFGIQILLSDYGRSWNKAAD